MFSFGLYAVLGHGQDVKTELSAGTCGEEGVWTPWINRDLPSGMGDFEMLSLVFDRVPCAEPSAVEARLTATGGTVTNEFVSFGLNGLICQNGDQPDLRCEDYEIRWCCEPEKTELTDGDCPQGNGAMWSSWFSRDFPSGTGDWELRSLIAQTTDELCENPLAAEARIIGTTDLTTTEAVSFSAAHGLSCVNIDQSDRRCSNYEVRFCCAPEPIELVDGECMGEGVWSNYYSRDLPSGTGDWELRALIAQTTDDLCEAPMAAEARVVGANDWFTTEVVGFSAALGLVCQNADQPDGRCQNYEVRFCCEPEVTELVEGECNLHLGFWTNWISRDLPSGTGDWELHSDALNEGRKVCEVPIAAEARNVATIATTTSETVSFGLTGLVCKNIDQGDGRCDDYEVRYCCEQTAEPTAYPTREPTTLEPTSSPTAEPTRQITKLTDGTCSQEGIWSNWLSRDYPSGTGDWELLAEHMKGGVCSRPAAAEARIIGHTALGTNEIVTFGRLHGLSCVNAAQPDRRCENYEIRFCCEPDTGNPTSTKLEDGDCPVDDRVQWTSWFSRDFPSLTGDWEVRAALINEGYMKCEEPLAAEARIIGQTSNWTPEVVIFSASYGLACQNAAQPDRRCEDYEIRFCCKNSRDITVEDPADAPLTPSDALPAPEASPSDTTRETTVEN